MENNNENYENVNNEMNKKSNNKLTVILIIIVIILLLAVGISIGLVISGKGTQIINNITESNTNNEKYNQESENIFDLAKSENYTSKISDDVNGRIAVLKMGEEIFKSEIKDGYYVYEDNFSNRYNIKKITDIKSKFIMMGNNDWAALFKCTISYVDNNGANKSFESAVIIPTDNYKNASIVTTYEQYTGSTSFVRGFGDLSSEENNTSKNESNITSTNESNTTSTNTSNTNSEINTEPILYECSDFKLKLPVALKGKYNVVETQGDGNEIWKEYAVMCQEHNCMLFKITVFNKYEEGTSNLKYLGGSDKGYFYISYIVDGELDDKHYGELFSNFDIENNIYIKYSIKNELGQEKTVYGRNFITLSGSDTMSNEYYIDVNNNLCRASEKDGIKIEILANYVKSIRLSYPENKIVAFPISSSFMNNIAMEDDNVEYENIN